MLIVTCCSQCNKEVSFNAELDDIVAWKDGKLIQDALPYLTVDERDTHKWGMWGVL